MVSAGRRFEPRDNYSMSGYAHRPGRESARVPSRDQAIVVCRLEKMEPHDGLMSVEERHMLYGHVPHVGQAFASMHGSCPSELWQSSVRISRRVLASSDAHRVMSFAAEVQPHSG